MEDLIATTATLEQPVEVDDLFDFFNPATLEASIAVESFIVPALQRRLVQLLTYNDVQLDEAMGHITAIEKLLGLV